MSHSPTIANQQAYGRHWEPVVVKARVLPAQIRCYPATTGTALIRTNWRSPRCRCGVSASLLGLQIRGIRLRLGQLAAGTSR
jgi:hypothetical protein